MENGLQRITAECKRQVKQECWGQDHDDRHCLGELSAAACCYAEAAEKQIVGLTVKIPASWPWELKWWKPSDDPIRNLEKAGALIAAEIDRLLRTKGETE